MHLFSIALLWYYNYIMQKDFESKDKIVNKIIVCMAMYLFVAIILVIDLRSLFPVPSPMRYEGYSVLYNSINILIMFLRSILMIIIFAYFIKLRASNATRKLYKIVLWILIAVNILSFLTSAAYTVIFNFFPKYISQASFDIAMMNNISRIYAFIAIALPVPFYIAILVREKLDYNWMIIGTLMNTFIYMIKTIAFRVYAAIYPGVEYGTKSIPDFFKGSIVLIELRSHYWLIGAIVLVIIFKKRYKKYKDQSARWIIFH